MARDADLADAESSHSGQYQDASADEDARLSLKKPRVTTEEPTPKRKQYGRGKKAPPA